MKKIRLHKGLVSPKDENAFFSKIDAKSIKANDNVDWISTIRMTDNDKDFLSLKKENVLTLTRIRRIGILKFLPKVIIELPLDQKHEIKYMFRLGTLTAIVCGFASFLLILNIYYHFAFGDNTLIELMQAALGISAYFGLIYIEVKIVEYKLRKYEREINKSA